MTNPDHDVPEDEGRGGLVRRVLHSGPSPEQRLEEVLARRRKELDEHAARLRDSIDELERREELLRDSRTSVERMLRIGTSDLETREAELTGFLTSLTERETALADAEAELARRRQELGAVELKRAAVERRERAVEARESELANIVQELEEQAPTAAAGEASAGDAMVELVFVPGDRYQLVEIGPRVLGRGHGFEISGTEYSVARIGRSPLPGDRRRCAYLVLGRGGLPAPGGSS